jgi:hypothetical protein
MNRAIVLGMLMAVAAAPAAAQQCMLEYQRADNMWAAPGRPDGPLGKETLTLEPGQTKVFNTDWKYEKQRNDGANYYGSHTRIVRNAGKGEMRIVLKGEMAGAIGAALAALKPDSAVKDRLLGRLHPGASWLLRADIMEVSCQSSEAKVPPPGGLAARQTSQREIVLTWQKVPEAKEYRLYIDPPARPDLAGRPSIAGASGTRWVITLPPSVAPSTVYRASIETVGPTGAISERVQFNPVAVQLASGPGGTPQSGGGSGPTPGGTASSPAVQRCPPGEFVTGLDGAGKIVCARP